jgi:hypothetical protein
METEPRHARCDTILQQAVAIADPCAVLLENGPGFSFVIARGMVCSPSGAVICLDDVMRFRIDKDTHEFTRFFDSIEVLKHETGLWIAWDPSSMRVFSSPSEEPYVFVFMTRSVYDDLKPWLTTVTPIRSSHGAGQRGGGSPDSHRLTSRRSSHPRNTPSHAAGFQRVQISSDILAHVVGIASEGQRFGARAMLKHD